MCLKWPKRDSEQMVWHLQNETSWKDAGSAVDVTSAPPLCCRATLLLSHLWVEGDGTKKGDKSAPVCACVCVWAREEDNFCFAEVRDKDYFIPLRWEFKTLPWDSIERSKWKTIIKYAPFFFIKKHVFFLLLEHMGLSKVFSALRCVCM